MDFNDKKTSIMKLVDLLKTHEPLMQKCPEVIDIIENLYIDIEKNQIIEAYRNGRTDQQSKDSRWHNRTSIFYYNETYNQ